MESRLCNPLCKFMFTAAIRMVNFYTARLPGARPLKEAAIVQTSNGPSTSAIEGKTCPLGTNFKAYLYI